MKSIMMTALLALVCGSLAIAQDKDDADNKIIGSGNVITKELPVQAFDELSASGVFSLVLAQGSKDEVKIEADDNLQQLFEVKNDGSKLNISMKKNPSFSAKGKLKVYVTFRKIKSMDLRMVGSTSNEGQLNLDNLTLHNKSVGDVSLKLSTKTLHIDNKSVGGLSLSGKADDVTITNKSVGSIKAADFVVQKMDIDNTGVGSAEVNAEKECKVKDSYMGKVKNVGAAEVKKSGKGSSK